MQNNTPPPGAATGAMIALGAALAVINGAALWALLNGALSPAALGAIHAGCTLVAVGAARTTGQARDGVALQLALWTLAAGAFGSLVWLAAALSARRADHAPPSFSDWLDAQIRDDSMDNLSTVRAGIRDDRFRLTGAHATEALCDIFARDCSSAKLNALAALVRNYDPRMAPALAQALGSDDAAVRVLGAGVLARLQQRHADTVASLLAQAERQPHSAEAWSALANAHLTFADSGLLNRERRHEAMTRAHDAETLAHTLKPAIERPRAATAPPWPVSKDRIRVSA